MNSIIFLTVSALIYSIINAIIFFRKKKINKLENRIYSILLIVTIISMITELSIVLTHNIDIIGTIIQKLFLVCIIVWISLFMCYTFIVTLFSENKDEESNFKKYKRTFIGLSTTCIILSLIVFLLPIYFSSDEIAKYTYGPSVNVVFGTVGTFTFVMTILMLTHLKKVNKKGYLPITLLVVLLIITAIIQKMNPAMLLTNAVFGIIVSIMYHTIENPDVKMIAQLNEAKAQAEKANNAKSEFLSSMSHEIRTPLNAIVGFSQALSEEDLSDEAREEVKDIISASNTLLDIVNGILDISKIEANKLEIINKEYNFKDIFDELVALTKGRLGEKPLEFKYIYDESIPSVLYGDHVRVKQIILNLLTNSVKYTKEGSITFTVNSVKKDDVIRLIVSVEDTGIGIKEENIGKLFSKFERFDEKNTTIEGTGLGLAITKQLVELMNGKIVVQSVYGKGSKFTVALDQKIVHGKVIESKDNNEDVVEFDLTGKKVLIVDDNNLNLKVASRLIKNYKCDITTVTSGIECLDKINNKEVFDLILMDDMMPRMSGGETLIRLKKIEGFNIPVVALTANAVTGMKEKYLQQGFDDYLAKPIEKRELNRVLHKFLKED